MRENFRSWDWSKWIKRTSAITQCYANSAVWPLNFTAKSKNTLFATKRAECIRKTKMRSMLSQLSTRFSRSSSVLKSMDIIFVQPFSALLFLCPGHTFEGIIRVIYIVWIWHIIKDTTNWLQHHVFLCIKPFSVHSSRIKSSIHDSWYYLKRRALVSSSL